MKKWFGIFFAVSLVLLLGTGCIVGKDMENRANAGKINKQDGFLSQVIQSNGKDYVVYKNKDQKKFRVACAEQDLYQYKLEGTAHLNRVYYVFSFINEAKQNIGIEPVSKEAEENWYVPCLEVDGTFLAAGSAEDEILVSILW